MTTPATWQTADPATAARDWLLERVSLYQHRDPLTIDPTVPLAEYGLDSVGALSLCGDLEDEFGLMVEPTLLWDHPTLDSLVGYLTAAIPAAAGRGRGGAPESPEDRF
ncbi:acyl carrier protein [Kitasatospora sp. NBC_00070]|uniref:acyl carrier protein n=1 Tax=Kitasatospora sp. NBC_00070 TaxID=2975962 RepID=UPI0032495388